MIYLKSTGGTQMVFYLGDGKPFKCFYQRSSGSLEQLMVRSMESYQKAKEELERQGISVLNNPNPHSGIEKEAFIDPKTMRDDRGSSISEGYHFDIIISAQKIREARKILLGIGFYQIYVVKTNFIVKR